MQNSDEFKEIELKNQPLSGDQLLNLEQLLVNSCTAFSCAQLFVHILQQASFQSPSPMKMLRLFEISIYSRIWTKLGDVALEDKSLDYLKQYLLSDKSFTIFINPEELDPLNAAKDTFLFIIKNLPEPHTVLVLEQNGQFVWNKNEYCSWDFLMDNVEKIISINLNDVNVELIIENYDQYCQELIDIVYHAEHPLHNYVVSSLLKCINVFQEYMVVFPTFILNTAPDVFIDSIETLANLIKYFPALEIQERFSQLLFEPPTAYWRRVSVFNQAIAIFSKEIADKLVDFFITMNPCDQLIPQYPLLQKAITTRLLEAPEKNLEKMYFKEKILFFCLPEFRDTMADRLFAAPEKYLRNVIALKKIVKEFPAYRPRIIEIFFKDMQRYISNIIDFEIAIGFLPEYAHEIHKRVRQNPRNYFDETDILALEQKFPLKKYKSNLMFATVKTETEKNDPEVVTQKCSCVCM